MYTLTKKADRNNDDDDANVYTLTKKGEEPGYAKQTARGIGQGALDVSSMALGLPLYPVEKGMQGFLHSQAERMGLPKEPVNERVPEAEGVLGPAQEQQFSKQHDILSRIQSGQMPTQEELQQLSDEYISPGGSTMLGSIQAVQNEIPEGGIYQEGVRRATRSLPFAATGALGPILGAEASGMTAKELTKAAGGGETAQTVADITGGLGYGLKNLFMKTPTQAIPAVAEKQGGIMQAIEQHSPKAMEKRLLSLSENTIKDFDKKISDVTDKQLSQLSQFSAREIENAIVNEGKSNSLNKITPQDQLPQEAWKGIQEGANSLFEAEQSAYKPLYENTRKIAEKINTTPTNAISTARNVLNKLTNVKTSPTGYTQTANLVRDVLHDLTGVSPSVEIIKTAMETGNTKLLDSIYESLNKSNPIKANKLMDLSIRLNDAINYEALTPSVKDWLKPLQRSVKEEFRSALKKERPASLQAYNHAEDLYKKTANRFGKDSIASLRSSENPEKMIDVFSNPSNFENLVKLFGQNSAQVQNAERQIIDQLGKSNTKTANELFRQLEPYLSTNAKEAGKEIIALGDKLSIPGQRRALQSSMLEDVAQAITTGQPPNFTTRAMMTPEGYQTAKSTFARSPNGKELFKTLEKKLVSDLLDSVVTDGQIDWQKAAQILENPNTSTIMQEIIGTDGLSMLKNMQKYGQNITSNLGLAKAQSPSFFNKFINKLDSPSKLMLAGIVGKAVAAPLWLMGAASTVYVKRGLAKMLTSPRAREAIKNIANFTEPKNAILRSVNILNEELLE